MEGILENIDFIISTQSKRRYVLIDISKINFSEDASVGKEFLLAVTKQNRAGTFIFVSCATDTTINVFAPHVNLNETHQIMSGTYNIIPLDNRLMNEKHQMYNKGVYITADKPISIYVIENVDFSLIDNLTDAEGYLALPLSAISTEYVIATDSANSTMCQFVIAALENDTIVNVTFETIGNITINDMQYSSGNVFSLKMSKLDTFQVQHIHDITGTFLQSNEPVAVFSGCICGYGPAKGTCQHEVEQIVPVHSLGQEYITVPLFPSASYRYRIVSPFNNNIVSIHGKDYMIDSGEFLERWDTEPIYIHASKPVMVIEYGQCTHAKCQNGSDPSMIIIPSTSAFSINYTFEPPKNLTTINLHFYLLVTIRTNRVNDLMLDRKRLNLERRYTVTTDRREEYTILVTNITSGYHKLHHPDPSVRYGALLYGTGQKKSIGFALGYHTDPSKPNVTFIPTDTQNIRLIITIVSGQAAGYEIIAVSYANGNMHKQKGKFLPNQRKSIYDFTSTDLPGTCFNFSIVTTIGTGQWVSSSEPVIAPNVCYVTGNLSKPVVRSEIQLLTMERNQLVFHCDFDPSSDLSMLYQVTWYRDKLETESKLMSSKHTLYFSRENFRSRTYLPETGITLGMTLDRNTTKVTGNEHFTETVSTKI
ncbi:hypothetical protein CHS0354_015038 [Potamilus streckersoni]|uniref:IgGFc-binding protein N-terminal domain-containing protein n=1 Tax=Potamilus streckersoni TaxID=2493646 RepID=A0AAE0TGA6_9BIVA|nr:hypothetical protein CHS0354_015038 [Potamilus streckersoni]